MSKYNILVMISKYDFFSKIPQSLYIHLYTNAILHLALPGVLGRTWPDFKRDRKGYGQETYKIYSNNNNSYYYCDCCNQLFTFLNFNI